MNQLWFERNLKLKGVPLKSEDSFKASSNEIKKTYEERSKENKKKAKKAIDAGNYVDAIKLLLDSKLTERERLLLNTYMNRLNPLKLEKPTLNVELDVKEFIKDVLKRL